MPGYQYIQRDVDGRDPQSTEMLQRRTSVSIIEILRTRKDILDRGWFAITSSSSKTVSPEPGSFAAFSRLFTGLGSKLRLTRGFPFPLFLPNVTSNCLAANRYLYR